MQVSQLIDLLQYHLEHRGDVEVNIQYNNGYIRTDVESVYVDNGVIVIEAED